MTTRYGAIVGCKHYYGTRVLKPNQVIMLKRIWKWLWWRSDCCVPDATWASRIYGQ